MPDADLSLAIPSVFFGAVGTAGQRCTSTRRLYLHREIAPEFLARLQKLYKSVVPGDPLDRNTLLGPLHTSGACDIYSKAIDYLRSSGAEILTGGNKYQHLEPGNFVEPTIAIPESSNTDDYIWKTETFAPILNVALFDDLEQAIEWNNNVPQASDRFRRTSVMSCTELIFFSSSLLVSGFVQQSMDSRSASSWEMDRTSWIRCWYR